MATNSPPVIPKNLLWPAVNATPAGLRTKRLGIDQYPEHGQ